MYKTVNFRLKIHLRKGDFGKTSLRDASLMMSFRRLRHFLAFVARTPLPRQLLLHITTLILSVGDYKNKKIGHTLMYDLYLISSIRSKHLGFSLSIATHHVTHVIEESSHRCLSV